MWQAVGVMDRRAPMIAILGVLLQASPRLAAGATDRTSSIIEYLERRPDLRAKSKRRWIRAAKTRFGGAGLESERASRPEIRAAKEILSAAIFMRVKPKAGVQAAWEGYRGVLGYVPPPVAVHYQILSLSGRRPRGRPIDLAFRFPDFFNEEIAPALVAYWEKQLKAGRLPDFVLEETEEALERTRELMRPLLLDKLRLLARLAREETVARGARRAEIQSDRTELEAELKASFSRVARRPEVLDAVRRPYDRLRIQLEDMGLSMSAEDRYLDPELGAPPRRPVPEEKVPPEPEPPMAIEKMPPKPEVLTPEWVEKVDRREREGPRLKPTGPALEEPDQPPPPSPPPAQPRPGDPKPTTAPMGERTFMELLRAYRFRLKRTIKPWIGTPYAWGGQRRGRGADCSGFVKGIFSEGFAVDLPRVSRDQYRVGFSVRRSDLLPGDLVFFDTDDSGRINHVGIYTGEGRFAHASRLRGVVYAKLKSRYYRRAFRGARRVLAYPARTAGLRSVR